MAFHIYYFPDIALLAIVYLMYFLPLWKKSGREALRDKTVLYLILSLIFVFTAMPFLASLPNLFSGEGGSINLVPFKDWYYGYGNYVFETVMNVLLFIPFGFWIRKVYDRSIRDTLLTGFLLSAALEFIQLIMISGRICDISDLITNSAGTLIGALLFTYYRKQVEKNV